MSQSPECRQVVMAGRAKSTLAHAVDRMSNWLKPCFYNYIHFQFETENEEQTFINLTYLKSFLPKSQFYYFLIFFPLPLFIYNILTPFNVY